MQPNQIDRANSFLDRIEFCRSVRQFTRNSAGRRLRRCRVPSARFFCFMVMLLPVAVSAQQISIAKQQDPASATRDTAVINDSVALGHRSKIHTVDLGELPTDRPVELNLRIVNDSPDVMVYDTVEVSCSCIRARLDHAMIEPGKESICRILLDTTQKQSSHLLLVPVKLVNSDKPVDFSIINLKAHLEGYLGFGEPYSSSELTPGEEMTEIVIPFIATPPVVGDLVQVELVPSIATHHIEPAGGTVGRKDNWSLRLKVRSKDIPKEGLAVAITLADYATDRNARSVLMLRHNVPASINPRSIRLARMQGDEDFSGNCILTIRSPAPTGPNDTDEVRSVASQGGIAPVTVPIVSAAINGRRITADVRSMNHEHFRISVRISPELLDELTAGDASNKLAIDWSVSSKGGAFQLSTPIIVTTTN